MVVRHHGCHPPENVNAPAWGQARSDRGIQALHLLAPDGSLLVTDDGTPVVIEVRES